MTEITGRTHAYGSCLLAFVMRHLVLVSLFLGGAAGAGPLGKVVDGMREASRDDRSDDDDDDDGGDGGGTSTAYADDDGTGYVVTGGTTAVVEGGGPPAPPVSLGLDGALGVAAIRASGPAVSGALAIRFGSFAVTGALTSFFEETDDGEDVTRLDLWRLGGAVRLLYDDRTELWLDLAFAGAHADPDVSLSGFAAGGRLEHLIAPRLAVSAMAGAIALAHDVTALELGVFVRVSVVSLGYRLVDFDVGPPLHGPELGLRFSI